MKRYNSQLTLMRRDLRSCKAKIAEQQKQIVEYATRLDENDKKNEETSRKFSTLLQVFTKVHLVFVRITCDSGDVFLNAEKLLGI